MITYANIVKLFVHFVSMCQTDLKNGHRLTLNYTKGCLKKTATFCNIDCNYYCHHNDILSIESKNNIFIWLLVMLLMTKYSNEFSFLDLVTIQIQLNNFKCRHFFETPFSSDWLSNVSWPAILVLYHTPCIILVSKAIISITCLSADDAQKSQDQRQYASPCTYPCSIVSRCIHK